jgi:asparagine synthase (glutamine-hydrolysing)
MKALNEKFLLKKAYEDLLPPSIVEREKQPYRAPISQCFVGGSNAPASSMISREAIEGYGYFDPERVEALIKKSTADDSKRVSAREDMALVGIVSLQLLHHHFVENLPATVNAG